MGRFAGFPIMMEPVAEYSRSALEGMRWVVRVGWLRGKVDRDQMKDWCIKAIHRDDEHRWIYDKGGNWYFRYEENAMMFFLAWS